MSEFATQHRRRIRPDGTRMLEALAMLAAAVFGGHYLYVAYGRVVYPYDLDFVENGMLMQALRFAEGLPVFVPPNADFVPHVYMPLYTWLGGLVFKLTGPGYVPLRLLSLAATLAIAVLIYWITRREGGNRPLALVCACLFLTGYRITGGWYELARVDALYVALTMAGVSAVIYATDFLRGVVLAALLLALASLTKQTGPFIAFFAACYLLLVRPRRAWQFIVVFALATAVPVMLMHITSGGWFSTYVFGIVFANPLEWRRALYTVAVDIGGGMAVLCGMFCVMAVLLLARARSQTGKRTLSALVYRVGAQPWLLFIAASLISGIAGRTSVGGARNQLIQIYAYLCLAPVLLLTGLNSLAARPESPRRPWRRQVVNLIWGALILQFAVNAAHPARRIAGYREPEEFVPTAAMRKAGGRLVERLRATSGHVFIMMHPFYAVLAGKEPSVQIQALWHSRWRGREPLPSDLASRIRNHYYAVIISDQSPYFETEPALQDLLKTYYRIDERLTQNEAPSTMSGMIVRPQLVYVPRREPGGD